MARRTLLVALVVLMCSPSGASGAAPDCPDARAPRTLVEGQPTLESVAVDPLGRLLFSTPTGLMVLDRPGGTPRPFAAIDEPGGIVFEDDGRHAIVGTGDSIQNGSMGDVTGPAGLVRVELATGKVEPFATGLSMANGVARHPDGTIYSTNDFGRNVDRIKPTGGEAERGWAKVQSGNGLEVESSGRFLLVAQTFQPAAIQQVDLRNPSDVRPYVEADADDSAAGLDGTTIDASDRLYAVANGAGEVWRIEGAPPRICKLARGLPGFPDGPSDITLGRAGTPFAPENAYVVTFDGHVYELAGVARLRGGSGAGAPAGSGNGNNGGNEDEPVATRPRSGRGGTAPRRVRVSPRRVRAGRRVRFTVVVEQFVRPAWRPVAGARIRFAGRTLRTNRRGRAVTRRRFARAGRRVVRVGAAKRVIVRVTR
ncbi:MAG: hypothetical protein AVDCRST_MAG85-907 [uncultured Solirubrobacteraceae bacterium]|uniref:SMP-30/Gluconolactonase/LRE-like region domain-containing protein n=1 Tax=uncultured Solirubrobacteraceae bacterium TaxID=1162706 RepID=A0A6J4S4S4_9ACTN|nr:MAG: hypothetical protein AVDCRST_MAG85-907 [uncultured Solirubrobacteraceae bacterium]